MKKTMVVVFAMMLIFSSFASAGFLDWFFNGFGITGAPTAAETGVSSLKETEVTLGNPLKEGSFLKYNSEAQLGNGVTLSSTYDSVKETATIKFSKEISVKNNQKVKLDSGNFVTKVSSGYIRFNRGQSIVNKITPLTNSVKDTAGVKSFLININIPYDVPIDKPVMLSNGFTARAHKESDGSYSVVYSKSVTVSNKAKLLFKGNNMFVKVASKGVTFAKSIKSLNTVKEIAIPQ